MWKESVEAKGNDVDGCKGAVSMRMCESMYRKWKGWRR